MRALIKENRKLFVYLIVANLLVAFGHRIWQAVFDNFAVERLALNADAIGWIQSAREVPGLIALVVGFIVLVISEVRLMPICLILLGGGLLFTGQATSVPMLIAATLVMSLGFHLFEPLSSGILLMAVDGKDAAKTLGIFRSVGAFAGMIGMLVVLFLVKHIGYTNLFLFVGGAVILGGLLLFPFSRSEAKSLPEARKVRLRKRYSVFYLLAFLMGSRRHIFTTFAGFLLVKEFGVDIVMMVSLRLANTAISTLGYPLIGRLVDRIGERRILTGTFLCLIGVFLGYAFVKDIRVLYALFIVDNLLFGCNIALTTYLRKISVSREELTSNLSAQTTINHISAVILPVVGGAIWIRFGSQAPFLVGVGIAAISAIVAQWVRIRDDAAAPVPSSAA